MMEMFLSKKTNRRKRSVTLPAGKSARRRHTNAKHSLLMGGFTFMLLGILLITTLIAAMGSVVDTDSDGKSMLTYGFDHDGESHTFYVSIPADAYIEDASFEIVPVPMTENGELMDSSESDFLQGDLDSIIYEDSGLIMDGYSKKFTLPALYGGVTVDNARIFDNKIILTPARTGQVANNGDITIDTRAWYLDQVHIVKGTNGMVHLIYVNETNCLFYINSANDGKTWSTPVGLSTTTMLEECGLYINADDELFVMGSEMLMGGTKNNLYKSVDNGTSWKTIAPSGGMSSVSNPKFAFGTDGTMHAVAKKNVLGWPPAYYVKYFNSTDGGNTWSTAVDVRDTSMQFGDVIDIAVDDSDTVHIVWDDGRFEAWGDHAIMYANSTDNFVNNKIFFDKDVASQRPSVGVNGTTVHIAWIDNNTHGTDHIKYVYSLDSGLTFSSPVRINDGAYAQTDYCLVVESNGYTHWAWTEERVMTPGCQDIFYHLGTTLGASGSGDIVDSQPYPLQYFPDLYVDESGNCLSAYFDNRSVDDDSVMYTNLSWFPRLYGTAGSVMDLGKTPCALTGFSAVDVTGSHSDVTYKLRTSDDKVTWTAWEAMDKEDNTILSLPARYVEWEANLSTTDVNDTPEFISLELSVDFYETYGNFVSRTLDVDYIITDVKVTATGNTNGCYFNVSAADSTWTKVLLNEWTSLEFTGTSFKYWVQMHGTTGESPTIGSVKVEYRADILPKDLEVDLGNDGTRDELYPGHLTGKAIVPIKEELRGAQVPGEDTVFPVKISASYGSITVKGISITIDQVLVIESFTPQEAILDETGSQEFSVVVNEPDGDDVTYKWYVDNTVVGSDDTYNYVTGYDDAGSHVVKVEVSDGRFAMEKVWNVIVNNVNRAPSVSAEENEITLEWDEMKMLDVTAADPDGDALTHNWTIDGSVVGKDKGSYNFKAADRGAVGVYEVKCSVTDGDLTAEHVWAITVNAPVLDMVLETESLKIEAGNTTTVKLTFTGQHLTTEEVVVTVSPDTFTAGGTYTVSSGGDLVLAVSLGTEAKNYTLELTATAGIAKVVKTLGVEVFVKELPTGDDDDDDDDDNVTDDDDDDDDDDVVDDDDDDKDVSDKESSSKAGMIIGVIVALVVLALIIAAVLYFVMIRKKEQYVMLDDDLEEEGEVSEEED